MLQKPPERPAASPPTYLPAEAERCVFSCSHLASVVEQPTGLEKHRCRQEVAGTQFAHRWAIAKGDGNEVEDWPASDLSRCL